VTECPLGDGLRQGRIKTSEGLELRMEVPRIRGVTVRKGCLPPTDGELVRLTGNLFHFFASRNAYFGAFSGPG